MSARPPLPPYGRRLLDARRLEPVNVFVYAGARAHELARPKQHALAVPSGVDWRALNWSCISGLALTLVSRGWTTDETDELARNLALAGAELVVAITVTRDTPFPEVSTTHFRPARREVAA